MTNEDILKVKSQGFLIDKTTGCHFNGRVLTINGKITAEKLQTIADASKLFGNGEVAFTSRLTVEIQHVPFEKIPDLIKYLNERGLKTGGTGAKVRPIASCKGTTCQYGLIDTYSLSERIHNEFYEGYGNVKLPHKFKIGVGGCPNNCMKPNLNDVGVIGQRVPTLDVDKCRGCKVCAMEKACPIKISSVVDGKIYIPKDDCNNCGRCVAKCPFHVADESVTAYRIFVGGRFGKKYAIAKPLKTLFYSEEEVCAIIEKCILLYKLEGITGERFADLIDRIGLDEVERRLLSNELVDKKDDILK